MTSNSRDTSPLSRFFILFSLAKTFKIVCVFKRIFFLLWTGPQLLLSKKRPPVRDVINSKEGVCRRDVHKSFCCNLNLLYSVKEEYTILSLLFLFLFWVPGKFENYFRSKTGILLINITSFVSLFDFVKTQLNKHIYEYILKCRYTSNSSRTIQWTFTVQKLYFHWTLITCSCIVLRAGNIVLLIVLFSSRPTM